MCSSDLVSWGFAPVNIVNPGHVVGCLDQCSPCLVGCSSHPGREVVQGFESGLTNGFESKLWVLTGVEHSVGEVRSGPVPGHFCWTGDPTVPSLTQFLGPGPGPPRTIYIGLVPVQTGSRRSLHILFIYLFKIKDGGLVWDGTAPRCSAYRGLGAATRGRPSTGEDPDRRTSVSFPSTTRGAGSHRAGIQSG